jgi:hypothetical protein
MMTFEEYTEDPDVEEEDDWYGPNLQSLGSKLCMSLKNSEIYMSLKKFLIYPDIFFKDLLEKYTQELEKNTDNPDIEEEDDW